MRFDVIGVLALCGAAAGASAVHGSVRAPAAAWSWHTSRATKVSRVALSMDAEAPSARVRWLPPFGSDRTDVLDGPTEASTEAEVEEDVLTLPVFPLGVCYLPFTSHVLNIFEPRYRQMYSDILFNGSRRFVVTMVDGDTGRLAKTGVVFYLDELKEVSEQTGDAVKYVCQHSVIGRVDIEAILNPSAWETRETYLKARVRMLPETADAPLLDDGADGPVPSGHDAVLEAQLCDAFKRLVDLQDELDELPRFAPQLVESLNVSRADEDGGGIWGVVTAWHSLQEQRVLTLQNRMQADLSKRVMDFLRAEKGMEEAPPRVRLEDLPNDVRADLAKIQAQYRDQLEDMEHDPYGEAFQLLLQARTHTQRVDMFRAMVEKEEARLRTRASLKKLFDQS